MKEQFIEKRFNRRSQDLIIKAEQIIEEYLAMGYSLTLRQLYYQFVARDWLPQEWADKFTGSTNNQTSYNNLGRLISDARLAGLLDWSALEDRTRNLHSLSHWSSPKAIVQACAYQFRLDKWRNQPVRVEVWIEKDALTGVIGTICDKYEVPFISTRGYISQSELYDASKRFGDHYDKNEQKTILIHLSDHDPSGIDMHRDLGDRLGMFLNNDYSVDDVLEIHRIALTTKQVRHYSPPPNPAKATDSRFRDYQRQFGDDSWELDALDPRVITGLIEEEILLHRDQDIWEEMEEKENSCKKQLRKIVDKTKWVVE